MNALDLLAMVGMASIPVSIGLGLAWRSARTEAQIRAEIMRDMRTQTPERNSDLRHLQDTVESLAVEIERLAEGQRFTARILAERASADHALRAGPVPRTITPH